MIEELPELSSRYDVPPEAVEEFRTAGHTVLRGLASREEVAAYRPLIEDAVKRLSWEKRPIAERDTYSKAFLQVMNIWRKDDAVRRFSLARRFGRVAADLLGVDDVRIYHDQALFKEAGGGKTPFHQDQFYWPLDTDKTITMWMPLIDVPKEVGSMFFAEGSQNLGYLGEIPISDESDEVFKALIDEKNLKLETHGALSAGDATFHGGWMLHGAGDNPTGVVRSVMTVIYFPDGARAIEPDNPFRQHDLKKWLPGVNPGEPAASEINPVVS